MSVRFKITLTLFATGLLTALAVVTTVLYALQRFEQETAYQRATVFLDRVVALHSNLFDLHERQPEAFVNFLKNLLLFEVDTQLYLLAADGTVLSSTGSASLAPGFKVALGPVRQSIERHPAAVVMGDDPERMDADAVVAARPLRRSPAEPAATVMGYLYLVSHKAEPESRWHALRTSFARPVLGLLAAIVALTTLLSALVVASVTRPLRRLTEAVATLSEKGLQDGAADAQPLLPAASSDEFGQLTQAFVSMLATLKRQWDTLRRLDHFRREAVSNLSHDLRSPLTATTACLETLEVRWADDPARAEDRHMAEVALRNTRNAARLVQSLGDLATLDEPAFTLRLERVDLHELLADIALRFAERAAKQGVNIEALNGNGEPAAAQLDVELFERAMANLLDNALKFCKHPGHRIVMGADTAGGQARVWVQDDGPGIPADDLPHLFNRFYQARQSVAPATGEGGRGLGLAIVKRIAELHGGDVTVTSAARQGTHVELHWPSDPP